MNDPTDIDDPLVPSRDDWEQRVEELLQGDDVDADLGRRMARDAIRVSRGELNDKEFQEKYREEVVRAFGMEDWAIADDATGDTDDRGQHESNHE